MRILIIRHAIPDYDHDSITPEGRLEAEALSRIADSLDLGDCYVSPLGRARETAAPVLRAAGKTAVTLPWLREFQGYVRMDPEKELLNAYHWDPVPGVLGDLSGKYFSDLTDAQADALRRFLRASGVLLDESLPFPELYGYVPRHVWDMKARYYGAHPEYMDREAFRHSLVAAHSNLVQEYDSVTGEFDKLLASYGYVRDGFTYRVEREWRGTISLFCHYGVSCVLLSHLMNCSPYLLWENAVMQPSSVTETVTEEREQGTAQFRMLRYGDVGHLLAAGIRPSFHARFTDIYSDQSLRHDE
jgi:probable phosphoglycerate mutase